MIFLFQEQFLAVYLSSGVLTSLASYAFKVTYSYIYGIKPAQDKEKAQSYVRSFYYFTFMVGPYVSFYP